MWVIKMDAEGYDTGLDLVSSENGSMSIYPNPTTSNFTIKLADVSSNHRIALYNQLGEKIKEIKVVSELTTVNVSGVPTGIYFVQITDGASVIGSQKVVVSKQNLNMRTFNLVTFDFKLLKVVAGLKFGT